MNTHIPTLLLREWMQHKRGWLIAAFAPPLLFLAMLPFGLEGVPTERPEQTALVVLALSACVIYVICLLVALFQLPGLARRDTQDRSIEFWLSLPGRPSESVAATVLAHAWLAPVGGAVIGALFGLPIAVGVLASKMGVPAALGLNWGAIIGEALPLLLRGLAGSALLTLWLMPIIFVLMAASAWLKRLGVPVVLVGGAVAVTVLYKAYDIDWPLQLLADHNRYLNHTLVYSGHQLLGAVQSGANLWTWALQDLGQAVAELVSVPFAGWAAVAAAGFALVVMKRARGG